MDSTFEPYRYSFLEGTGEIGQLISEHDWSRSSLGCIENWPISLRITVGNILHSAFPMFLFWGKELLCFYNDAYRPSLGVNGKHPAIGKPAAEVWTEIWDVINPLIQQVLTTGKAVWYEDRLIPIERNGQLEDVYWTFSYSPAYGNEGMVEGVLVTCMETTEQVMAKQEIEQKVSLRTKELERAHHSLVEANVYLQNIINLFKEPLQVLEPVIENGNIVDFCYKLTNAAYAAYAHATPEELQNKKVSDYFPGYFQTSSFLKIVEIFQTGVADTWEIHYNVDGLDLYNQMSATRIGNEIVVHFTDFTKLKNLELQLLQKIKELERSNKHLEEFAHAASHDLKEPIRKIQVFTNMVKEQLSTRLQLDELHLFGRIDAASQRMRVLVDDLLLFSQVSQIAREKEIVPLKDIIERVLEDLDLDVQQKGASISFDTLPAVPGYRRQLQQMFQNLISNAVKYSKPGRPPRIDITANKVMNQGRAYHLIEVQDNGIGFEPKYSDEIFSIFTRLHNREEYAGTGVGLSIVKKIVENHNGSIQADSVPDRGSNFKVWLPSE